MSYGNPEKYNLLQVIIRGKIIARRNRKRPQTSWIDNLKKWFIICTSTLFRAAIHNDKILPTWFPTFHNEYGTARRRMWTICFYFYILHQNNAYNMFLFDKTLKGTKSHTWIIKRKICEKRKKKVWNFVTFLHNLLLFFFLKRHNLF